MDEVLHKYTQHSYSAEVTEVGIQLPPRQSFFFFFFFLVNQKKRKDKKKEREQERKSGVLEGERD